MSDDNTPYKKREIDSYFMNQNQRMDKQDMILDKIERNTSGFHQELLNLRVDHEALKDSANARWWAAVIVVTSLVAILTFFVPYSVSVIKKDLEDNDKQTIQQGINNAVSSIEQKYDVEIDNGQ